MSGFIMASPAIAGYAVGGVLIAGAAAGVAAVMSVRAAVLLGAEISHEWRAVGAQERACDEAAQAATRDWHRAVAGVVDRNAAITTLAATADRHQVPLTLPDPLRLTTESTADLRAWVWQVEPALRQAEAVLAAALAGRVAGAVAAGLARALGTDPPPPGAGPDDLAIMLAQRAAATRAARGERPPPAGPDPLPELARDVARILGRLSGAAAPADLAAVAETAARFARCRTTGEAGLLVDEIRLRVQAANQSAGQRQADQREAARLRQGLADWSTAEADRLADQLDRVIAGTAPLTGELADAARAEISLAAAADARRYLSDLIMGALAELGYETSGGFEAVTAHEQAVRITRDGWPEHAVRMVADRRTQQLRAAVVRTRPGAGDERRRVDQERAQQWCASFAEVQRRLAEAGVEMEVQLTVAPEEYTPILEAGAAASQPQAATRHRERPS